jgi:tRNA (guanine37-N1)-methyltransferase
MNFHVLTLFPEMVHDGLYTSVTGNALKEGVIHLNTVNIRDYATNKHNRVDRPPYGGGAGMIMQPEPVWLAYEDLTKNIGKKPRLIYLTPQGSTLTQAMAREFAKEEDLIFLCGHYEGIDERVLEEIVTDYVSIGDYVLTGGELPAMVMIDVISRLVPGVLGNEESAENESFQGNLLEHPHYTRPYEYHGKKVPEVLITGHHANIERWRREQSLKRTFERRKDLLEKVELTPEERHFLEGLGWKPEEAD